MAKEIVNIRINKEQMGTQGVTKWFSHHVGEILEAERTVHKDGDDTFCSYKLTQKGADKLNYLRAEKNMSKGGRGIIYSDCCDEVMYLVYARPEEHYESEVLIGYAKSELEAQKSCEKLTKMYKVYQEVKEKAMALANTIEMEETEKTLDVPRWKAGIAQKDITAEMREERDSIRAKNLKYDEDTMEYLRKYILGDRLDLYLSGYDYRIVKRV
jgi:hypothetical protein